MLGNDCQIPPTYVHATSDRLPYFGTARCTPILSANGPDAAYDAPH